MCGIAGVLGRRDPVLVQRMCDRLRHRGPDEEGFYHRDGVSLGMRRLSIIDLKTGQQPMSNEDETVWLVFNGEIYNFPELRKELVSEGHRFRTSSDTEVIVHGYESWGEDVVRHLDGDFAVALWDQGKGTALLARDPLGVKPLYYARLGQTLLFASELKALTVDPALTTTVDQEALDYYLTFLYIPSPLSIFREIRKLPPGHRLTWAGGEIRIEPYWNLAEEAAGYRARYQGAGEREVREEAIRILQESVRKRLLSDVPLGAFLSGGLDSSSIVALMSRASSRLRTFTIGYGDQDASYNETEFARCVASAFGTEHQEFQVRPDLEPILDHLVEHLDEPFADSSAIPTYLICRAAASQVKVALSGVGGDEVFCGYPRYLGARLSRWYQRVPRVVRSQVIPRLRPWFAESDGSRNWGGWFRRFTEGGLLEEEERYLSWVRFLTEEERRRLLVPALAAGAGMGDVRIHQRIWRDVRQWSYLDRIFYLDMKTYLSEDLLAMADRMSMAHSLEVRVPFCDKAMVAFSLAIPWEWKMKGWTLKHMLKTGMKDLLPASILHRKKQGFMIPLAAWFKGQLNSLLHGELARPALERVGLLEPGPVAELIALHESGRKNVSNQLWSLLVLQLWMKRFGRMS